MMKLSDILLACYKSVQSEVLTEGRVVTEYSDDPGWITVYGVSLRWNGWAMAISDQPELVLKCYAAHRATEIYFKTHKGSKGLFGYSKLSARQCTLYTSFVWWGVAGSTISNIQPHDIRGFLNQPVKFPMGGFLEARTRSWLDFCSKRQLKTDNYILKIKNAQALALSLEP